MNKLPLAKRVQILSMLCEGMSMRSVSRVADVSINTVTKLLVDAGEACLALHDDRVRAVAALRVQCDEIWSFCYAKQRNVERAKDAPIGAGSVWTWTALDADSKLIISYIVGDRSADAALLLMADLRGRLANRVQLTTDGNKAYVEAIQGTFGDEIDYAQLVKLFGRPLNGQGRYSPSHCHGAIKQPINGRPEHRDISTSYVERSNLSIRMGMRRFTRLTNAFSKKLENHVHALALYFAVYNFCRVHKALKVTPAMAAGLSDRPWLLETIAELVDERAPKPGPRGPYRKRGAPADVHAL